MVLKIAGTFLEAPEAGAFNVYEQRQFLGHIGDMSRRRAKEERRVKKSKMKRDSGRVGSYQTRVVI